MSDMCPSLKAAGGSWYHIAEHDGRRLTLSKASLGEFVYEVLKVGGEIHQLWPFNRQWDRSPVYPVVALTPAMRDDLENRTGFKLVGPPKINLNGAAQPDLTPSEPSRSA